MYSPDVRLPPCASLTLTEYWAPACAGVTVRRVGRKLGPAAASYSFFAIVHAPLASHSISASLTPISAPLE